MENQGLTVDQAARVMGVTTRTIRRYVSIDKLEYARVDGPHGEELRIYNLPEPVIKEKTKDKSYEINISQTLEIIKELQAENLKLGVELGRYQERIIHLEDQVKLLTAGRQPWWRRVFRKSKYHDDTLK